MHGAVDLLIDELWFDNRLEGQILIYLCFCILKCFIWHNIIFYNDRYMVSF